MKIQLTKTTPIPDETWSESNEHPVQPVATNYAGAELEVSEELGNRLVDEGSAVILGAPAESGEPLAPDAAGENTTGTFMGDRF